MDYIIEFYIISMINFTIHVKLSMVTISHFTISTQIQITRGYPIISQLISHSIPICCGKKHILSHYINYTSYQRVLCWDDLEVHLFYEPYRYLSKIKLFAGYGIYLPAWHQKYQTVIPSSFPLYKASFNSCELLENTR